LALLGEDAAEEGDMGARRRDGTTDASRPCSELWRLEKALDTALLPAPLPPIPTPAP
jgi:hypothetical protein